MSLEDASPQKSRQLELPLVIRSEPPHPVRSAEAPAATTGNERPGTGGLMELVCERQNLLAALRKVRQNGGSPGIDGMKVEELDSHLRVHWPKIREALLAGLYQPERVRRVMIPKPGGGERELGIPTVLDRFIQQAILQILQPRIDPTFSEHSYGFRPKRSAHDAVHRAHRYVLEGRRWVVDIDLEKFFDRVNHDVLMGRLARRVGDRRVLGLVRRYLEAGVLADGVVIERAEGTPQGGPLSPLLANILLDDVDKELEKRGHAFVRYADDLNVYVRSKRAGERVMEAMRRLYGRLRLRVNDAKSAVADVTERKFLGFSFWQNHKGELKRRVAPQAVRQMKDHVRELTARNVGRSIPAVCERLRVFLRGWKNYFQIAESPRLFKELDGWIRHRLRALQLKHWRHGMKIFRELRARGGSIEVAAWVARNANRRWFCSAKLINFAMPNRLFDDLGLPRLYT